MSHRRSRFLPITVSSALLLALAACGSTPPDTAPGRSGTYKLGDPYQIAGRWYHPSFDPAYDQVGVASWYGDGFHGRATANGEVFDKNEMTAAHPTMPLPSIVQVTNLANDRTAYLRVNDRGPFIGDRLIDVSQAAARTLGFEQRGTASVRVRFLRLAEARGVPPAPGPRPAPVQRAGAAPGPACDAPGKLIQVGAFAEPARAQRVARRIEAALPVPVVTEPPSEDHLMRVRLGPLARADEVEAALQGLERIGHRGAFLVQPTPQAERSC